MSLKFGYDSHQPGPKLPAAVKLAGLLVGKSTVAASKALTLISSIKSSANENAVRTTLFSISVVELLNYGDSLDLDHHILQDEALDLNQRARGTCGRKEFAKYGVVGFDHSRAAVGNERGYFDHVVQRSARVFQNFL